MESRDITVKITAGTVVTTVLVLAGAALLWYLRNEVLMILTAVVIASSMEPGIRALNRWGMHRVLAVVAIYLTVIAVVASIIVFFIPPVLDDAANFLARLPDTLHALDASTAGKSSVLPISDISSLLSSANIARSLSSTLGGSAGGAVTAVSTFFGGALSFILVVVFSFYFCVQETGVEDFLHVVSPMAYHDYIMSLWKRAQEKIGKWMQGQFLLGLLVGTLIYLGLVILGMPFALLLAVLAAICELIPVFGQILMLVPGVVIAFTAGGPQLALEVGCLFIIVHQFESHLFYPLVVKKVIGMPPLMVILALVVGGKMAGFVGVLLAVPLATVLREFINDIEHSRHSLREAQKKAALAAK